MLSTLLVLAAAVGLGAAAQRSTGIGFSLVVGPACALVLGPTVAIGTLARLASMSDLVMVTAEHPQIDWRTVRALAGPAIASVPVALVVEVLVPTPLLVVAACLGILASVGAAGTLHRRTAATPRSPSPVEATDRVCNSGDTASTRVTGFGAGFLGLTTGMCSPPLALRAARSTRPLAADRASMAAFFLVIDAATAVSHSATMPLAHVGALGAAMLLGTAAGSRLSARVGERRLRGGILVLGAIGAVVALIDVLC